MVVKDIMNCRAVICTEDLPLNQVYQMMQENECESIVVVESCAHQTPIGIVTEHDICLQVIGKGRDPRSLTAASVMNTDVVRALYTASLADCSEMLAGSRTKRALIVDEEGTFRGTLSHLDLETSKTKEHIAELLSRAIPEETQTSRMNRIY